jgi:nicotinamide mononucleotide adenylyltransferase
MKRALFIGRWQPIHDGHRWLFSQKLEQDIPILIAVRDTPVDDSNPFSTAQVIENLEKEYTKEVENGMVKIMSIPDIESVNYGRGVGYEINEFVPPVDISNISATEIRKDLEKK